MNDRLYLIVSLSDGLEALLTCCVPYLHANTFSVDLDRLDFEVDSCVRLDLPIVVR